jgi:hypothetical protein
MVTVVLTVFSLASSKMYSSINKSITIEHISDESAWILLVSGCQSGSIAVYRPQAELFAVDLTASPACADEKCFNFSRLYVPETVEGE